MDNIVQLFGNGPTKFRMPIRDFTSRYDEPTADSHGNLREIICGVIAALIFAPLGYIAFCAVLALGDVF